jgi:hypothetical protein
MRTAEGLRNEALSAALDEAVAGRPERLYVQLGVASGLPGTRANMALAQAFATDCAARGRKADALVFAMAEMNDEAAPGATAKEFLPVCGVIAVGARAADDPKLRRRAMKLLHDAAEDTRFRVREAVPLALARLGEAEGDALVHELASWMDGFFHAAAVLRALADKSFLAKIDDTRAAIERLDDAYRLARDAPRSATRWPGWKALVEMLACVPAAVAGRFGVRVFDLLAAWADTEIPELRAAIEANLKGGALAGRYTSEIARVRDALVATTKAPRDPTIIVHGTRGRGKKRRR